MQDEMSSTNHDFGENLMLQRYSEIYGCKIGGVAIEPKKPKERGITMSQLDESTLGRRIKLWRDQRKMKQKQLQNKIKEYAGVNVGQNYLSELENDKADNPSLRVAAGIAKALNVSLDYFGFLINEMRPLDYAAEPEYISPEADEVAKLIDSLPAQQRTAILDYVRSMARVERIRHETAEVKWILDSIERKWGREYRLAIENDFKGKESGIVTHDSSVDRSEPE